MALRTVDTEAERPSGNRFTQPMVVVGAMVAVMWAVEIIDLIPGVNLDQWGIKPRRARGLLGIPLAPFLHTGLRHLIANTIPFVLLGAIIAFGSVTRFVETTIVIALTAGTGVWLLASPGTVHLGASGLVMGYFLYLVARGFFSRKPLWIVGGIVVMATFGFLWYALLPGPGRSWTGHLFGAVGGVLAAWLGAAADHPKPDDPATTSPTRSSPGAGF